MIRGGGNWILRLGILIILLDLWKENAILNFLRINFELLVSLDNNGFWLWFKSLIYIFLINLLLHSLFISRGLRRLNLNLLMIIRYKRFLSQLYISFVISIHCFWTNTIHKQLERSDWFASCGWVILDCIWKFWERELLTANDHNFNHFAFWLIWMSLIDRF